MEHAKTHSKNNYTRLLVMAVLSFVAMYILMYTMVNMFSNVIPNINQFYMAGLMASAMVIIELFLMKPMYGNKKWNLVIIAVSVVALVGFFMLIRWQAAIGDKELLRSMVPHHAGAILMCEESQLQDPEIKELCQEIVAGQQEEIDFMRQKLEEL